MIEQTAQEDGARTKRRLHFQTWKLDFYSFAIDLTIEPNYWIVFILRTGKRVFKWEYTILPIKG